ncbi:MAG: dipeptidase [Kiritimatiellae bacterium]|nr:dipeptidase [Kiritimatiellia bacterium]MDD5520813.1 dipeptidase [Kiritimatiellia bacterium]
MTDFDPKDFFAKNEQRFIDEWKEFLTFPSISADPAHEQDCLNCASWLVKHLDKIGFSSRLLETSSKPVVFAEHKGKPGKPVVLFYGHYDVQPVDPLNEWQSPPFQPAFRNGRIYARGAEDNKGQLFAALKAMETLISHNKLNCTVKIAIEGEEEYGSRGISKSLEKWKDILKADILMACDTSMSKIDTPTIIMGLRGIVSLEVQLTGPIHDIHSGMYGGIAPNPAAEMAKLIASLHNPDGSIAVAGMYDSVTEPSPREKALANSCSPDINSYTQKIGVPPVAGEKRFTPPERVGFRPSIDINGIHSGYGGPGGKTIIPSRAIAKITSRLVPGQDPALCLETIIRHLEKYTPAGLNFSVTEKSIGGPGFRLNLDSPLVKKAGKVLKNTFGKEPMFMWEGASIPIVAELARISGAEPLLIGFGLDDDKIHAPNESFSIEQFRMGYLYSVSMLSEL